MKIIILTFITLFTLQLVQGQSFKSAAQVPNDNVSVSDNMTLYPNPVTVDEFTVKAEQKIETVEVYNVLGNSVFFYKNESMNSFVKVNVSRFEKGLYIVKVVFADQKASIKKILIK